MRAGCLLNNTRKTVAVSSALPKKQRRSLLDWRASATFALLIGFCLVMLPACGKKHRVARGPHAPSPSGTAPAQAQAPRPPAVPTGYTEQGLASWYGVPYHGRPAADGEIYNMETLVAAHRVMPFNTWLRVTNLRNNKSVDVRIIDRGPFVGGRIIDLSKAAARQIELLGPGVGQVRLEVISAPVSTPTSEFYAVQVGAFSVYENAERVRASYAQRFGTARLVVKQGSGNLWRVLVGKEPSFDAAQQLAAVISPGKDNVFVVRLDPEAATPTSVSIAPGAAPASSEPTRPITPPSDTAQQPEGSPPHLPR
jgi:rare lipoprotein A